ncbi:hypothetical protein C0J52_21394 [Blattella germanica]|nr:hypothetical protein C0J52_21394 [Blattella germanica]
MKEDLVALKEIVNPAIYSVIITVGLLLNGILIYIFVRHREIRTPGSAMILNLAVSDVLNLGITAPIMCIFHYPHDAPDNITGCRIFIFFRQFTTSLSALSLVGLSIQRFCITFPELELRFHAIKNTCSASKLNVIYVSTIWMLSIVFSFPLILPESVYSFLCGRSEDHIPTSIVLTGFFFVYCMLLPGIMISLSSFTAERLRRSVKELPSQCTSSTQLVIRNRSATIVMSLAWMFVLSHLPLWTWAIVTYWAKVNRESSSVIISEYIFKYLLFLDSCLNPIAMYLSSGTLRKLVNRCVHCEPGGIQDVQSVNTSVSSSSKQLSLSSNV